MTTLTLLDADGGTRAAELGEAPVFARPRHPLASRTAFAAAHVVPKAWADNTPGRPAEIDWDATLAFRHHVWSWGLGVADAMDTAQRNMGLDPAATRELITRSAAEAQSVGGRLVVGVNTDHVDEPHVSLDAIVDAYTEQLHHAEDAGAGVVLMASRHLARAAASADDYRRVYDAVLARATTPVILHWLGPAFDPELAGYFGSPDAAEAASTLLAIIADHPERVAGVKMSLLDAHAEVSVRRRMPAGARMFTGDDYHYVDLVAGDAEGHSDALLGAFAALAPNASAAIQALDAGDEPAYRAILEPTEALSQHVFAAPTFYYKTGIAFLAWLNGHQPAFQLVGGLHAARSLPHLSRIVELANLAGALERPELAAARWGALLAVNGVEAAPDAVGRGSAAAPDAVGRGSAGAPDAVGRTSAEAPDAVGHTSAEAPDAVGHTSTAAPDSAGRTSAIPTAPERPGPIGATASAAIAAPASGAAPGSGAATASGAAPAPGTAPGSGATTASGTAPASIGDPASGAAPASTPEPAEEAHA